MPSKEGKVVIRRTQLSEILSLRHRVLRAGLPIETAQFAGDENESTVHVGAFASDGACVGCATLHDAAFEGECAFQLRGMAVAEDKRGSGIGAEMLREIEAEASAAGVALLWCNARRAARGFYEKHGWQVVSQEFDIPSAGGAFSDDEANWRADFGREVTASAEADPTKTFIFVTQFGHRTSHPRRMP